MLFRVTVSVVLVISAVVAKAQTAFASQAGSATEQIETGRIHLPGHNDVIYRIRLLPVAAFPALPQAIVAVLNDHHCLIPQTYEARRPENVIRGSFEKQGSDDWAVLCSVNGTTTLYVFFQSQTGTPISLRQQRNTEWLGAEIVGAYGSAWGIALRRPSHIPVAKSDQLHPPLDHDGIEDSNIEKSSSIHYFQGGSWITVDANQ